MKPKIIILVIIILVFIVAGAAWSGKTTKPQTSHSTTISPSVAQPEASVDLTDSETVVVKIVDFQYSPQNIRIKKNTKVTWVNEDDMEHNVMLDHEDSEKPHDVEGTHDPNKLESPLLKSGETYEFTFKESSHNSYHCSPHPWMKGTVEVVD